MKEEYVLRLRPRRLLRGLAVVLVLVVAATGALYLARGRILTWIGAQLVNVDPLERSDAILVLAGGSPERELEAADLYHGHWAPRIVMTRQPEHSGVALLQSRGIAVRSELDQRLGILRELRVPASAVTVLDGITESTEHESRIVLDWARGAGIHSLIVVTSAFHTGRARLTFRPAFHGSGVAVRVRAASADDFAPSTWWKNRVTLRNGLIEWQKQVYYRVVY